MTNIDLYTKGYSAGRNQVYQDSQDPHNDEFLHYTIEKYEQDAQKMSVNGCDDEYVEAYIDGCEAALEDHAKLLPS